MALDSQSRASPVSAPSGCSLPAALSCLQASLPRASPPRPDAARRAGSRGARGWGLSPWSAGEGTLRKTLTLKQRSVCFFQKSSLLKYFPKLTEIPYRISLYISLRSYVYMYKCTWGCFTLQIRATPGRSRTFVLVQQMSSNTQPLAWAQVEPGHSTQCSVLGFSSHPSQGTHRSHEII